MITKIQLRELTQSITNFTGCQLILLFKKEGGSPLSIALSVSPDGFADFEYLNDLHVEGKINLTLKAPTGNVLANKDVNNNQIINQPTFQLDFTFRHVELGESTGPIVPKRTTINGKLMDSAGTRKIDEIQIIIFAGTLSSPPSELQPILSTNTETGGYFSLPYPDGEFSIAYALVGIESATGKNKIDILLDRDETGKTVFPKRLLLVVEPEEGAVVEQTKTDCGCNEFNFHEQKRILEEFSYYSIIRTSDPEIKAYSIEEAEEISLDDLLQVSPTSSNPIITGIVADPLSVFGHPISNTFTPIGGVIPFIAPGTPGAPPLTPEQVSQLLKNVRIKKRVVQQFLVQHKVLNKDTYLKLLEMNDAEKINAVTQPIVAAPLGRVVLDSNNMVDYDKDPTVYEATSIAYGHLLHYKQQWVADGYSLGDLLYSLPLAPGQKKQIVTTSFSNTLSGSQTQEIDYEESLNNSLSRDRDINEIASGVVNEKLNGSSWSTVKSASAGLGLAIGPLVLGASGGISKGSSKATQNSMRSTSARDEQHLSDKTIQSANAVRSQRTTVIQTVSQGEESSVTAETVANYNHCHAITIQYFEVLRHFKVQQRLVDAQECLFVPLPITRFDIDKARRWKEILLVALMDRSLKRASAFDALQRVKDQWEHSDFPATTFAAEEVINLTGNLKIRIDLTCPADALIEETRIVTLPGGMGTYPEKYTVPVFDPSQWDWMSGLLGMTAIDFYNSYIKNKPNKDEIFRRQIGDKIAQEIVRNFRFKIVDDNGNDLPVTLDASLSSTFHNGVPLAVTIRSSQSGIPREKFIYLKIALNPGLKLPDHTKILVKSGSANYRTKHMARHLFNYASINDDLGESDNVMIYCGPSQEELRNPKETDVELVNKLLYHLNANLEAYHIWMFKSMPEARRHLLLDGINLFVEKEGKFRSVASLVVNKLIGVIGNSLVLPVIPGLNLNPDFTPKMLNEETGEMVPLIDYYAHEPVDPSSISVTTPGVYAEAMMGKCNSCEIKEEQRFWRWEESPIPDSPTSINPVNVATPTVVQPNLQAAPLANPVVNIQNAPAAPDPMGLSGVLNLLGKGDTFRDITGLNQNQLNALAALQKTMDATQNFGKEAAELVKAAATNKLINDAQKSGAISNDKANELTERNVNSSIPPTQEQEIKNSQDLSDWIKKQVDSGNMTAKSGQELHGQLGQKLVNPDSFMTYSPDQINNLGKGLSSSGISNLKMSPDGNLEVQSGPTKHTIKTTKDSNEHFEEMIGAGNYELASYQDLQKSEDWMPLLLYKIPDSVESSLRARNMTVQYAHNAGYSNDLNIDYYPVRINKFPIVDGIPLTPEALLQHIRLNINSFIDTDYADFVPYDSQTDTAIWNSADPTNAVIKIDILGPDNASVVVSLSRPWGWRFTTVSTPDTGQHPVNGSRDFFMFDEDGVYYFVIKGLDMATTGIPGLGTPFGWVGYDIAEKLWRSMVNKVIEFINANGGEARKGGGNNSEYRKSITWRSVYRHYRSELEQIFGPGAGSPGA